MPQISAADMKTPEFVLGSKTEDFPQYMLHPQSKRKILWEFVIMLQILFFSAFVPVFIVFYKGPLLGRYESGNGLFVLVILTQCMWILDVPFNMNVAYFSRSRSLVQDRYKILRRYRQGWMFVDVVAIVPVFGLMAFAIAESSNSTVVCEEWKVLCRDKFILLPGMGLLTLTLNP
jgi:hypothetical protein